MNNRIRKQLARGKRKNLYRLGEIEWEDQPRPVFSASNIKYDLADKSRGPACGGIGAVHTLTRQRGPIDPVDRRLHLLKIHRPYHESDPVLNIAWSILRFRIAVLFVRTNPEVNGAQRPLRRIPARRNYIKTENALAASAGGSVGAFDSDEITPIEWRRLRAMKWNKRCQRQPVRSNCD